MASLPPPHDHQLLVKRINSSSFLIVKQMQHVCQLNGMRQHGVKADLQRRIVEGTYVVWLQRWVLFDMDPSFLPYTTSHSPVQPLNLVA